MNKYNLLKRVFPNLYFSKIVKVVENRYKSIKDPIAYTKDIYYKNFGCELNLDDPKTFYEKICFLKLFYHEEQPQNFVDKILVKEELKKQGYEKLVAKTICSFTSFNDFKNNLDSIKKANKQFVIKLNHTSGDVFFYLNNHGNYLNKN